ncbi:NAD(P)-binding domain-containing protein [Paraburkholderia sp. C35]|uniref:NADPH-dependent F420 reductase n=1 Tax=Paraburkholderia sp. C35 TaxID=2126993 RepID=UPI000D68C733|nr:NAD(P)-binding domain-containing protein [Paraburkholderia sp. C35]
MKIGFVGAAYLAQAYSKHLLRSGHSVVFSNRRGPESLANLMSAFGTQASAASVEAAAEADVVVLALPWTQLRSLQQRNIDWSGRIVVDATNALLSYAPDFRRADLGGRTSSEIVADMLPGARIVKTLNTLYYKVLERDPAEAGGRRVMFLSGDDEKAKKVVSAILSSTGFCPVDLGGLAEGGRIQQFGAPLAGPNLLAL